MGKGQKAMKHPAGIPDAAGETPAIPPIAAVLQRGCRMTAAKLPRSSSFIVCPNGNGRA